MSLRIMKDEIMSWHDMSLDKMKSWPECLKQTQVTAGMIFGIMS